MLAGKRPTGKEAGRKEIGQIAGVIGQIAGVISTWKLANFQPRLDTSGSS